MKNDNLYWMLEVLSCLVFLISSVIFFKLQNYFISQLLGFLSILIFIAAQVRRSKNIEQRRRMYFEDWLEKDQNICAEWDDKNKRYKDDRVDLAYKWYLKLLGV